MLSNIKNIIKKIIPYRVTITKRHSDRSASMFNRGIYSFRDTAMFLNSIITHLPGHVYWKNKEGVYLGCNDKQAKSLGLTSGHNIIGKTDFELAWEAGNAAIYRENDLAIMHEKKAKVVEEPAIVDGHMGIVLSVKAPLLDESDNVMGILGISVDITKQKQLEEELRIAKEIAEANDLKTRFIQDMQHDVRTPLSGIYQYMTIWAAEETDPEKLEYANLMKASAGQLLNMCNEIVDFEGIDYLGNTVKLESVETIRFLSRIVDLNKAAAHMRGVALHLKIDPTIPPHIKVDRKKLYRVLVNLVGNALKFTDEGTVTLRAAVLAKQADVVQLAFEVEDTGIGIPTDKFDLIFDKFVRLNPANQAKYKGSGLGLFYVKKFIADMGGKIEVESTEKVGSIFRIILMTPISTSDEQIIVDKHEINTFDEDIVQIEMEKLPDVRFRKTLSTSIASDNITQKSEQHKPYALLIEDDKILQILIKKTLTDIGFDVDNGIDTVEKANHTLATHKYDLVVCDMGLIDGTGLDVMAWVQHNKHHPNQTTPFIVLTANNDTTMHKQALENGFLEVFQKPLSELQAKEIMLKYVC